MISPIKVCNILGQYSAYEFEVVKKYETVDALWGVEHRILTDADIKALKEGKFLYCNNDEYAQIISYKTENEDNKNENN